MRGEFFERLIFAFCDLKLIAQKKVPFLLRAKLFSRVGYKLLVVTSRAVERKRAPLSITSHI